MGKGQGKLCVIFNKGRKGSRDIERGVPRDMGRERDRGPVETYKEREREREVLEKEGGTRDIGGERGVLEK